MTNTNDKPGQTPVANDANAPKQPSTAVTPAIKPATDEKEENKTTHPTTVRNRTQPPRAGRIPSCVSGTKQPTDPNSPQANSEVKAPVAPLATEKDPA